MRLSAAVVVAFVRKNGMAAGAVPNLIPRVHAAFSKLREPAPIAAPPPPQRPAVPIAQSVCRDHIVCLEDGKKLKSLKRYLRARFGMSPDDYRRKWDLAPDYPMIAPCHARRDWLLAQGVGGRTRTAAPAPAPVRSRDPVEAQC
jgi:predicted transcriptional regulator